MKKLHYIVEVRTPNGDLYKSKSGAKITHFEHLREVNQISSKAERKYCNLLSENYKAISLIGSQVFTEVRVFNEISKTYMTLYSYNLATDKFIKH